MLFDRFREGVAGECSISTPDDSPWLPVLSQRCRNRRYNTRFLKEDRTHELVGMQVMPLEAFAVGQHNIFAAEEMHAISIYKPLRLFTQQVGIDIENAWRSLHCIRDSTDLGSGNAQSQKSPQHVI